MCDESLNLLVGKTLQNIEQHEDEMLFVCDDGDAFHAYHMQDCCESVSIYDIQGDLKSLIGSPIVEAVSYSSGVWPIDVPTKEYFESFTWTIHRFRTASGNVVTVRWLGESNGYYSESVYFTRTHKPM